MSNKDVRVYLDTSFFFGAIHNQAGRRAEAERILKFERANGAAIFTSVLTFTEFTVRVHNRFRADDDYEDRLAAVVREIRSIALPVGFSTAVAVRAALFEGILGRQQSVRDDERPSSLPHRWDAMHLASAEAIKAVRIYGWDAKWSLFPVNEFPSLGQIICPAVCPQADLYPDEEEGAPHGRDEEVREVAATAPTNAEAETHPLSAEEE